MFCCSTMFFSMLKSTSSAADSSSTEVCGVPIAKLAYHWFLPISSSQLSSRSASGSPQNVAVLSTLPSQASSLRKPKRPRPLSSSRVTMIQASSVTPSLSLSRGCRFRRGRLDAVFATFGRSPASNVPLSLLSTTQTCCSSPCGPSGMSIVSTHWFSMPYAPAKSSLQYVSASGSTGAAQRALLVMRTGTIIGT